MRLQFHAGLCCNLRTMEAACKNQIDGPLCHRGFVWRFGCSWTLFRGIMFNNAARASAVFPEKGLVRKSIEASMSTNKYLHWGTICQQKHHAPNGCEVESRMHLFLNYFPNLADSKMSCICSVVSSAWLLWCTLLTPLLIRCILGEQKGTESVDWYLKIRPSRLHSSRC